MTIGTIWLKLITVLFCNGKLLNGDWFFYSSCSNYIQCLWKILHKTPTESFHFFKCSIFLSILDSKTRCKGFSSNYVFCIHEFVWNMPCFSSLKHNIKRRNVRKNWMTYNKKLGHAISRKCLPSSIPKITSSFSWLKL